MIELSALLIPGATTARGEAVRARAHAPGADAPPAAEREEDGAQPGRFVDALQAALPS